MKQGFSSRNPSGNPGGTSLDETCGLALTTFKHALSHFEPFENNVRMFEQNVSRGVGRETLREFCNNPYAHIDGSIGGFRCGPSENMTLANVANGGMALYQTGSKYPSKPASPLSPTSAIRLHGTAIRSSLKGLEPSDDDTVQTFVCLRIADQPSLPSHEAEGRRMYRITLHSHPWPLPFLSQYGRDASPNDNQTRSVFSSLPFDDIPVPDHTFAAAG